MMTNITITYFYRPEDNNAFNSGVNRMSGALQLYDRGKGAYEKPGVASHIISISNRPPGSPSALSGDCATRSLPLPVQHINPVVAAACPATDSSKTVATGAAHKTTAIKATPANAETTASQRIKTFVTSLFTAKNMNKAIRVAGLGITVAAIFAAAATLVGLALGPFLIVIAVGFGLGALVGLTATGVSRVFAKVAVNRVKNKATDARAKAGGRATGVAAATHNASLRGVMAAAHIGHMVAVLFGIIGNSSNLTKAILPPIGKAVGVIDTMMLGTANLAKQWGAGIGTAVAGCLAWGIGMTERELDKIPYAAASGSRIGASVGRLIDNFIFTPLGLGLIRSMENQYFNATKRWYSLLWRSEEPAAGPAEWLAAISGGALGGVTQVADIRTGGEITRIGQATDTARRTISFGKLLRAAGNVRDIRPGGTLNAVHTAWQTVSFGKMVSAAYNYFDLRIPHPA